MFFGKNYKQLNQRKQKMDQYQEINKIGQGSFGHVYKAKDKQNNLFAIKHIKFESNQQGIPATALRQISILKSVGNHPMMVKLVKVHYQALQHQLRIVFQYYHCDLKRFIKEHKEDLTEIQIKRIMKQLLQGVGMLHEKKIMHRDIKPQNIMLDSKNHVKIADFGLARYVTSKQKTLTREVETLWYRAPEVMLGMKQYTFAIDIWAVGCIFAELLLKRPLFLGGEHEIEQIYKVFEILGTPTKQQWPAMELLDDYSIKFPKWKKLNLKTLIKGISEEAQDLLQNMLVYDPHKRISAVQALGHPYLQQVQI